MHIVIPTENIKDSCSLEASRDNKIRNNYDNDPRKSKRGRTII